LGHALHMFFRYSDHQLYLIQDGYIMLSLM
jgi:hypothetical protein